MENRLWVSVIYNPSTPHAFGEAFFTRAQEKGRKRRAPRGLLFRELSLWCKRAVREPPLRKKPVNSVIETGFAEANGNRTGALRTFGAFWAMVLDGTAVWIRGIRYWPDLKEGQRLTDVCQRRESFNP